MADIKVVLRKKINKDGTYPLAIRITKDRKSSFIHIGHNVRETDWDKQAQRVKKSYPNSTRLNALIIARLNEANGTLLEAKTTTKEVTSQAVKQKIKPKGGLMFFDLANEYLEGLKKAGKFNQYTADNARIKYFKEFLKDKNIAFSDITIGLLERLKTYLRSERKVGERTVQNYLAVIRSVFGYAIANKVIERSMSPFGKEGISIKFPESTKVGISKADLGKLETVQLDNPEHNHARNLWLTSFYFAGMRISDVYRLRWSDFYEMRLHYTMGKNKKAGSVKMHEKALNLLAKYEHLKENDNDFVFPELKRVKDFKDEFNVQRIINLSASRCDKVLRTHVAQAAGIKAKLSMHIARHTFATLAGDKVPIQMLQKLYRHSDIKTTIGYQASFIHQSADDAIDAVIGG